MEGGNVLHTQAEPLPNSNLGNPPSPWYQLNPLLLLDMTLFCLIITICRYL